MKVEVLASVMNTTLPETVEHMNLQSDAVIINQCDRMASEEMQISSGNGESRIRFLSFPDRGIGRSRNEAILRAEGDICLFSDADIVYEDGYEAQQRRGQPVFDRIHKKRIPRLYRAGDYRQGRGGRIQLVSGLQ